MLYACTQVKADEALALGLVNAVYPVEELMDAAMKLAGKIAKRPHCGGAPPRRLSTTACRWIWTKPLSSKKLFGAALRRRTRKTA